MAGSDRYAWLMLLMGVRAFMISCVSTRVSRCHDCTSLTAMSWPISLLKLFSVCCMARSPLSSPRTGRRKEKSRLRTASFISHALSRSLR